MRSTALEIEAKRARIALINVEKDLARIRGLEAPRRQDGIIGVLKLLVDKRARNASAVLRVGGLRTRAVRTRCAHLQSRDRLREAEALVCIRALLEGTNLLLGHLKDTGKRKLNKSNATELRTSIREQKKQSMRSNLSVVSR